MEIYRKDNEIFEFVVQYESLVKDKWREIIRYDNKGKPPHKDVFDVKGKRYMKEIPNVSLKIIIPWCVGDIKENWRRYKARYLRWMKS